MRVLFITAVLAQAALIPGTACSSGNGREAGALSSGIEGMLARARPSPNGLLQEAYGSIGLQEPMASEVPFSRVRIHHDEQSPGPANSVLRPDRGSETSTESPNFEVRLGNGQHAHSRAGFPYVHGGGDLVNDPDHQDSQLSDGVGLDTSDRSQTGLPPLLGNQTGFDQHEGATDAAFPSVPTSARDVDRNAASMAAGSSQSQPRAGVSTYEGLNEGTENPTSSNLQGQGTSHHGNTSLTSDSNTTSAPSRHSRVEQKRKQNTTDDAAERKRQRTEGSSGPSAAVAQQPPSLPVALPPPSIPLRGLTDLPMELLVHIVDYLLPNRTEIFVDEDLNLTDRAGDPVSWNHNFTAALLGSNDGIIQQRVEDNLLHRHNTFVFLGARALRDYMYQLDPGNRYILVNVTVIIAPSERHRLVEVALTQLGERSAYLTELHIHATASSFTPAQRADLVSVPYFRVLEGYRGMHRITFQESRPHYTPGFNGTLAEQHLAYLTRAPRESDNAPAYNVSRRGQEPRSGAFLFDTFTRQQLLAILVERRSDLTGNDRRLAYRISNSDRILFRVPRELR